MNDKEMRNMLTDEERAHVEKLEAIFADEKNQEKMKTITDIDEIMAFYEENGFSYTEEQKEEVRRVVAEISARSGDVELTEDELEDVAGGWSWKKFKKSVYGAVGGGVTGLILGGAIGALVLSSPAGWIAGAGIVVGAVGGGTAEALLD